MADKDVTPFPHTSEAPAKADEVEITTARPGIEPPVVARMVIEIRSDGTRTVARGALEEVESGQTVSIVAEAESPTALAWSLAKQLAAAPLIGRAASRAMLAKGATKTIDVAVEGKKRSRLSRAVESASKRARRQVKSVSRRLTARILESALRGDSSDRD